MPQICVPVLPEQELSAQSSNPACSEHSAQSLPLERIFSLPCRGLASDQIMGTLTLLKVLASGCSPLLPCLLSHEGQVLPHLLGKSEGLSRKLCPFFLFLFWISLAEDGCVLLTSFFLGGRQEGIRVPPAARASSKVLALTVFRWRNKVDAVLLLCTYILQGQPSLLGRCAKFQTWEKALGSLTMTTMKLYSSIQLYH